MSYKQMVPVQLEKLIEFDQSFFESFYNQIASAYAWSVWSDKSAIEILQKKIT